MREPTILISEADGVIEATLNRPEKYNALDLEMWEGLHEATRRLRDRDDLRVLLLNAKGRYFSAGIDLNSELAPDPEVSSPTAFRRWYRSGIGSLHSLGDEWEVIEKPVVVAHQGPCLGGALEISLCADFRLASSVACYGLPEIALGGIPGSGGTSRLVRLAGPHWAKWLVLANRQMDASCALSAGLVHEIYEPETFAQDVRAFCLSLAGLPPEAFAVGKLAIELAADLDRSQGRNLERLAVGGLVMGQEYAQMMALMKARLAKKKES